MVPNPQHLSCCCTKYLVAVGHIQPDLQCRRHFLAYPSHFLSSNLKRSALDQLQNDRLQKSQVQLNATNLHQIYDDLDKMRTFTDLLYKMFDVQLLKTPCDANFAWMAAKPSALLSRHMKVLSRKAAERPWDSVSGRYQGSYFLWKRGRQFNFGLIFECNLFFPKLFCLF